MLKTNLTIVFYFFTTSILVAQNIGIGNNNPTTKLHITAAADPLRLEGVQSASATDSIVMISSNGIVKKRNSNSFTGWLLSGNLGNTTNNFIGNIDNVPFIIKTNNQTSALIEPDILKRNAAFGNRALFSITTGTANTIIGYQAATKLTTGVANTGIGDSALANIVQGANNVAIGKNTLQNAATATGNVAIGNNALKSTISSENIAIGLNAANNNSTGSNIIAIGAMALANNTITSTQIAVGNNALGLLNTSGLENIGIGYNAGTSLTNGSYNVLLGHYTFSSNPNGSNNTIIGHNAAVANSTANSSNNTLIGYQSALSQTGGSGNTFVGASVDMSGNTAVSNSAAIGQGVLITASNQIRIGNTNVISIGGQVGWTTFSDERIKTNIRQDVPGLIFITQLQPVTYNYDVNKMQQIQRGKALPPLNGQAFESIRYTGFLAQQVQQVSNAIGYHFSGIDAPTNNNTLYGIRYAELVAPLIQSVKELKAIVDAQQQQIDALKKQLLK